MTHIPTGRRCTTCKHKARDCSGLNFARMKVIKRYDGVKCTEFEKEPPAEVAKFLPKEA